MKEERLQILHMLEDGKINADEALQLLDTLEEGKPPAATARRKHLRMRIMDGSETKVNMNIPIQLAKVALRFVPKEKLKNHPELDLDELLNAIAQGVEGKIVEVHDGETHVEVYVE